jgi:hypothetical protein
MKKYFVFLILTFAQYGFAQTVWKADIPVVDKSDYYNVELRQELVGAGLAYIKIFDEQNAETPYFIRSANPIQEINNFENYKLESSIVRDSLNIIVVNNHASEDINRFYIVLQKAETEKFAAIRGSNDMKQWYIVKQSVEVSRAGQQTTDNTEMLILDFPQGNYQYYEITLWSNNRSPLDILKIGKIKNSNLYGNFVEIELGKFIQESNNDEDNLYNTYIRFSDAQHLYYINKIEFGIKNKPDYFRQAEIRDSTSYGTTRLFHLSLSSRKENIFFTNDLPFSPQTHIIIENRNNPPLTVDSIKIYGLCRYACVYLEAGKRYNLISDRRNPVSSRYDIEHFKDNISTDLPILQLEDLQDYTIPKEVVPKRELSLIEQPIFLWSVIIIVGAFLIFVCFRMIREVKKVKSENDD